MKNILLFCFSFILFVSADAAIINVLTPGTLSTLVSDNSITDLTVSGTIDARDFKFMLNGLNSLVNLDMKLVSIAAYTGTEGCGGASPIVYPANELPTYAFCDVTNYQGKALESLVMPTTITSIGVAAFWGCGNLVDVLDIPPLVTNIGIKAFMDCKGFTGALNLPSGLVSIGMNAFSGCTGMDKVTIPASTTSIGSDCFYNTKMYIHIDKDNGYYSSQDSVMYDKAKTVVIHAPTSLAGDFVFPSTVIKVSVSAFYNCIALESVKLDDALTSIGDNAFLGCVGLIGDLKMSSHITNIGANAFSGCAGLTGSLSFPETLAVIGSSAFLDCIGFNGTLTLPNSLTAIGSSAFKNCNGFIGSLVVPNSIKTVEASTFASCAGFTSLTIPSSVTSLVTNSFNGCEGLTSVYVGIQIPLPIARGVFNGVNKGSCALYVPVGTRNDYSAPTTLFWKDFSPIVDNGIWVSSVNVSIAKVEGSTANVNVQVAPATAWTATSDQEWLTPSPLSSMGDGVLIFTAKANPLIITRTALVTVASPGIPSKVVFVTQVKGDPAVTFPTVVPTIGKDAGSTATLPISSNTTWTSTSNQSWLTVGPTTPTIGDGNLIITATTANPSTDPRTAEVTITIPGSTPKTITVTQAGSDPVLTVPTLTADVSKDAGSIATVPFISNSNWTVTAADSWISVGPTSGKGNGTLSITTLSPNPTIDVRTTTVTINVPGALPKTITVTQAAGDPTLSVSALTANVTKVDGSTTTLDVTSNTTWSAVSDKLWLSPSPITLKGDGTLTFTATANPLITTRTATVTISAPGTVSKLVVVTQAAGDPVVTIPSITATITKDAGSTATIPITSNSTWTASSDQAWLSVLPITATVGDGDLIITSATVNPTTDIRTAQVTITIPGASPKTIIVTQAAGDPTLSVSTLAVDVTKVAGDIATVLVTSNTTWTATVADSWLNVGPGSLKGSGILTLTTVTANPIVSLRTTTVTITVLGLAPKTITVTQAVGDPTLSVADSAFLEKDAASMTTLKVYSNTNWTASFSETWLTVTPATSSGDGLLTFTALSKNPVLADREAIITLSAPGVASKVITVVQTGRMLVSFTPSIELTITKVYDKSRVAKTILGVMSGVLPGDDVTISAHGIYDDPNVGEKKIIRVTYTVGGAQKLLYKGPSDFIDSTGVIVPDTLTVLAQADSKIYDGTANSLVVPVLSTPLIVGDVIGAAPLQLFDNRNVSTSKVLKASGLVINDGNGGKNYAVKYVNAVGLILEASVFVIAQPDSRTYTAKDSSTVLPQVVGLLVPDSLVNLPSQRFDTKHVGVGKSLIPNPVTVSDGNGGKNYKINYVNSVAGVIHPASVVVTAKTDKKNYNGTDISAVSPLTVGVLSPDTISKAAIQNFDSRHVGAGKTISPSGLVIDDGNGGKNYGVIAYFSDITGEITPALVTITAKTDSITYNRSISSLVAPLVTGLFAPDVLATAPIQTFDNFNVGVKKTLTPSGLVINDGNAGNNYTLQYVNDTTAKITPLALELSAQTDAKVYDGSVLSAVLPVMTGAVIAPDVIATAASQIFDNRNAGINKTLKASGLVINDGNNGANYSISYVDNVTGTISSLPLILTAKKQSRPYNGTTSSDTIPELTGTIIAPDVLAKPAIQTFDTRSNGLGKTLTPDSLTINDGNGGKNYVVSYVKNHTGEITRATVQVVLSLAARADNKAYDGTTQATIVNAKLLGVMKGDDVVLDTIAGQFTQASVGKDIIVDVRLKLYGADVDNYILIQPLSLIADILPKELTVINALAKDKVYDGNNVAVIEGATLKGVVGVEDVVLTSATSGTFSQTDAGNGLVVTPSMIISGTAISNYSLTQPSYLKAAITPKPLAATDPELPGVKVFNGSPLPATKVYDGASTALVTEGLLMDVLPADLGQVSIKATAVFSDALVGTGKIVTVKYTLTGPAASHYKTPADFTYNAGEIMPKQLTIAAPQVAKNKMVDQNTIAQVSSVGKLQGVIAADDVKLKYAANYSNAEVGINKTITLVYTLEGAAIANYLAPVNYVVNDAKISDKVRLSTLITPSAGCEGSELGLGYSILSGDVVNYKITFDTAAYRAGMKDVVYTPLPNGAKIGILSIPIPENVKDGTFTATLKMNNELSIESDSYTFQFTINMNTDYIIAKFDDVVLCNNISNRFVSYQWFKDDVKIEGATKQYYYDPNKFSGAYSVEVTTTDGKVIKSCSKTIDKSVKTKVSAFPNPLKPNQSCTVSAEGLSDAELKTAVITIFNLQGTKVFEIKKVEVSNKLDLHLTSGIYVGKLITSSGVENRFDIIVAK